MTPLQKKAKDRNFAKMRVAGMHATAETLCSSSAVTTGAEKMKLTRVIRELRRLMDDWDRGTRSLGMNTKGSKKKGEDNE